MLLSQWKGVRVFARVGFVGVQSNFLKRHQQNIYIFEACKNSSNFFLTRFNYCSTRLNYFGRLKCGYCLTVTQNMLRVDARYAERVSYANKHSWATLDTNVTVRHKKLSFKHNSEKAL